jgi:hypothetical protein
MHALVLSAFLQELVVCSPKDYDVEEHVVVISGELTEDLLV